MKFAALALFACLAIIAAPEGKLPEAPGKSTFQKVCGSCHEPEVVTGMGHDKAGWNDIIDDMMERGATASPKQRQEVIDYLAKVFPKKPR